MCSVKQALGQIACDLGVAMSPSTNIGIEVSGPPTAPALLRQLGVNKRNVTEQFGALAVWLGNHRASPRLWQSLLANGYALLLEETVYDFHRPVRHRRITTASGRI